MLVFCIATPVVVMLSCMEVTIRRAGLLEVLAPVVDHEHFGCKWRTPACRKVGAADRLLRNDAYQLVKKKQSRDRNVNLNVYRGCIPVSFDNRHRVQWVGLVEVEGHVFILFRVRLLRYMVLVRLLGCIYYIGDEC